MCDVEIIISLDDQQLGLYVDDKLSQSYVISSALNGVGCTENSGKTPLGKHYIRACIGAGAPINSVFVGRRLTGECYSDVLAHAFPQRDWILTRILWLCGLEVGFNRLGNVDSMRRYIYIHGTPDTEPMGKPLSHGCVRMRNNDIIDLFERVAPGTRVTLQHAPLTTTIAPLPQHPQ